MTDRPQHDANVGARYSVAVGDIQRDKAQTLAVWREGGFIEHGAGDSARFDWFYGANPAGVGQLSLLSCNGGAPIGSLGACPRQFVVDEKAVLAGVLVDFVVHPAHRTALPALQLQRAARARATESMDIIYGLPDTKAIPIFKRLGHQVHFKLPSYARVLQSKRYLSRIMPALLAHPLGFVLDRLDGVILRARILLQALFNTANRGKRGAWIEEFTADFDKLWANFRKDSICIGVRDAAFLRWRFGQRPGFSYRTYAVRSKSGDELSAYFVCDIGADSITIKDCLCVGDQAEWLYAFNLMCREARRLSVHALYIHFAAPAPVGRALRLAGFRERSSRPFFAAVKEHAIPAAAVWYITQADEDV
jgi:hypothetical protein